MKPSKLRDERVQSADDLAPDAIGNSLAETTNPVVSTVPEERRILAFMGEVRRVGRWIVPRVFRVRALLGEVKVDLRENAIPRGFTFDVKALGSRVTLIVPPEVDVAFDVFALMGNAINQAHEPVTNDAISAAIRVTGTALLGEVRVLVRPRGA